MNQLSTWSSRVGCRILVYRRVIGMILQRFPIFVDPFCRKRPQKSWEEMKDHSVSVPISLMSSSRVVYLFCVFSTRLCEDGSTLGSQNCMVCHGIYGPSPMWRQTQLFQDSTDLGHLRLAMLAMAMPCLARPKQDKGSIRSVCNLYVYCSHS